MGMDKTIKVAIHIEIMINKYVINNNNMFLITQTLYSFRLLTSYEGLYDR